MGYILIDRGDKGGQMFRQVHKCDHGFHLE